MLHRSREPIRPHVDCVVLLHAAVVEVSLRDDVMLQTALEVVLLHAFHVLVVANVEAQLLLLLLPITKVILLRVGMEITSILPLGHLGLSSLQL